MENKRWYKHTSAFDIFSLARHLNDVILNYVFFVEIPLIQFGCLLLVCPLLCFFLPSVVVFLLLPEEDLVSKALVCLYHRSSSTGEYSFLVLFLTCLPHQQLLAFSSFFMQLCVNSVQDWVSNNGFKFSTSKTVCMHFCNQRKHFAEPSILDKNPIKVVTEAKFLGVIFDRTLPYSSHVNYL